MSGNEGRNECSCRNRRRSKIAIRVSAREQGVVLNRYILREAAAAWLAVTLVLLAVMVSTRFASVLNFAVKGDVPRDLLAQVAMLSSLRYLVILVPASLLLAIMLSLGRLYSDN